MDLIRGKTRVVRVMVSLAVCAFIAGYPCLSCAASQCQWVDATGAAVAENLTPDETKQSAMNQARLAAIQAKTGVKISSSALVKDFNLMADIIHTMAQGYIIKEKIDEWSAETYQDTKDSFPIITYKVKLKACVAGTGEKDPYFTLRAKLNKEIFESGEEAKLTITASRDSFLAVFNLTADDRIKIIAPTSALPQIPVKKNEAFTFPPEGFGLRLDLIADKKRATEGFIIVATRQPVHFESLIGKTEEITVPEFYRAVVSIPAREKTEEIVLYEVAARRR